MLNIFMQKLNKALWPMAGLLLFFLFMQPLTAQAATIRVCLQTSAVNAEFKVIRGEYTVRGGSLQPEVMAEAEEGDTLRTVKGGSGFTVYLNGRNEGMSSVNVSVLAEDADSVIEFNGRQYRGSFSVLTNGYILNVLDMEAYLYGVVGEEIGYNAPKEALRAQAIVARSYAAYNMGGKYYDVLATTASQVYGAYTAEKAHDSTAVHNAVDDTAGLVLYYDGKLVEAVFCSSAGGRTEDNENVWGGSPVPYLRGVVSPYDKDYAYYEWTVTYTPQQLKNLAESYMQRIKQEGSFGNFVRLELSYKAAGGGDTESGRVTKAAIIGTAGSVSAQRDAVRTMLGLRSTLFSVENSTGITEPAGEVYVLNAAGNLVRRDWQDLYAIGAGGVKQELAGLTKAYMRSSAGLNSFSGGMPAGISGDNVVIKGYGNGHGVGLSQYGAIGLAKDDYDAEEILRHYYGGEQPRLLKIDDLE